MNRFETVATVAEQGQIVVPRIPFEPGTEVIVTVRPKIEYASETPRADKPPSGDDPGLRWEGNVLVYQGTGQNCSVDELRNERLDHLAQGLSE